MIDQVKADRAVRFIKALKHGKGKWAGVRFNLQPWQEKIVRDLFGTVNADGTRQYRTAYMEVGRKNGKSELAAAIALKLLLADGEFGAEIYGAANDREQASLVFNAAATMVRMSPELSKICKIVDSQKRIVVPKTNSFYRAIPAEAAGSHGFNAHGIVFDELHTQVSDELWNVLTTSTGARTQPLVFAITTAGYNRESICYKQHEYARKILDGIIKDPTFYPVMFAADEADDWESEEVWKKANPALGDFRNIDEMRLMYQRAKEMPAMQNMFRMLYLSQWVSQETRWMDMAAWDATAGMVVEEKLKGRDCYAGIDLASTTDVAAVVLLFPMEDGTFQVLPHFFIPQDTAREKEKRDRVPYRQWAKQGFIHLTPGNVIDYAFIENKIKQLGQQYRVLEWAYDRWNADMLVQRLMEDGANMVPVGMGYASLTAPTKHLLTLVMNKQLVHGGHPVLRNHADNVMCEQDSAGNIKPSKKRSTEKIDGIMALTLAVSRAMLKQDHRSIYNDRDLLVL